MDKSAPTSPVARVPQVSGMKKGALDTSPTKLKAQVKTQAQAGPGTFLGKLSAIPDEGRPQDLDWLQAVFAAQDKISRPAHKRKFVPPRAAIEEDLREGPKTHCAAPKDQGRQSAVLHVDDVDLLSIDSLH